MIVAALFVMRHRFSSWRLTALGGGKNANGDAENEGDSSNDKLTTESATKEEVDAVIVVPATAVTENECLTSVENKQAIAQIESVTTAAAPISSATNVEEVAKSIEEAVACSETPLLTTETVVETPVVAEAEAVILAETPIEPQVSSSSLIANVLNDLSESVVSKLASTGKSPAKCTVSDDPEKQPLNGPDQQ
jgi:hypothetical protein